VTSGVSTVTSTSDGGTPTFSGTFTCGGFAIPTGYTLTDVDLFISNDYSLGTIGTTNTVDFAYTTTGYDSLALSTSVSGTGASSVSSSLGGIISESGVPACALVTGTVNTIDCDYSPLLSNPPTSSFGAFTVSGSATWVAGSLQLGGTDEFNVSAIFTYSLTPTGTPEPASLLLIGGGLLGLALVGRRKFHA
jgi:hypothetical protein